MHLDARALFVTNHPRAFVLGFVLLIAFDFDPTRMRS